MIEQQIQYTDLCGVAYIQSTYPVEQLIPLRDEIEKIKRSNFNAEKTNSTLVGNIEKEFNLVDSKKYLEEILLPMCMEYDRLFNYFKQFDLLTESAPLILDKVWVNFQKKHEFNPPHYHKGILSFVIWIDIPYNIEDEMNLPQSKYSVQSIPGHFQFLYTNGLGAIKTHDIPADKKYNNTLVMFPSKLSHAVYPFYTSDEYRVSVSGNFLLNTSK
jgi:hypothetical protein